MENEIEKLIKEKDLEEAVVVVCPYCGSQANKFRNYAQRYMCIACKKKFFISEIAEIKSKRWKLQPTAVSSADAESDLK